MEKRLKILMCAKRLFAKKGYDATSMDEVSRCANANKALIYYHFKSKENMYSTILLESISSILKNIEAQIGEINNPKKDLKIYVNAFYSQAVEDEAFFRILMREIASDGVHLSNEVMETFLKVLGILERIVRNGVEKNIFKEKDAKVVHFLILGTISFYLCSSTLRNKMAGSFSDRKELLKDIDDVPQQLYEIILRGLRNDV